jgi:NDP-sugar pyrophosphorylase family protein
MSIGGIPFIDYKLQQLKRSGFSKVVLAVGFLAEQIEDYCASGERWGLDLTYSHDPFPRCGTGQAVAHAIQTSIDHHDTWFVTYGDSLTFVEPSSMSLGATINMRRKNAAQITAINADLVPSQTPNCAILPDGRGYYWSRERAEQPFTSLTHVEYGMTLIKASEFCDGFDGTEAFQFSDWLYACSERQKLGVLEIKIPFQEIGTPEALASIRKGIINDSILQPPHFRSNRDTETSGPGLN